MISTTRRILNSTVSATRRYIPNQTILIQTNKFTPANNVVFSRRYTDQASAEQVKTDQKTTEQQQEQITPEQQVEKLTKELEEVKKKLEETKHELLISFADRETTRRIAKRDVESAKTRGIENFVVSLLDVPDNLYRALEHVSQAKLENNPDLKSFYEGVEMTNAQLTRIFEKFEVKRETPLGEKFDPNRHQAVAEVPDPSKEAGTISYVMKSGYSLKDRVIRAANVAVVASPPK